MSKEKFIKAIGAYVKQYAPKYGIKVHSAIIAQAILESASGTSELAVNANNFFGLKYKKGRCPTAIGIYEKVGFEQNADGSYVHSNMKWCKFASMEDGVIGYFDFINNSNYANLKGVTDAETYLKNIRADGYATSLSYVKDLMNVIKKYNLTEYDGGNTVKFVIDGGHGHDTPGKRCLKSLDKNETREHFLNDRIADKLEKLLSNYECEVKRSDDTTGKTDVSLADRVKIANDWGADAFISIHHNAGANGRTSGGTVVYYYSSKDERKVQAQKLYNAIVGKTKLVGNRAEKVIKNNFYVLANTKMPAFLIENGFMDSSVDVPIILTEEHAEKTAQGILEFLVNEYSLKPKAVVSKPETPSKTLYRVQLGAFSKRENAEALVKKLKAAGFDAIIKTEN